MQNNFKKLTTEATNTEYNWNNYPRPNLKRESFFPLNDFWDLSVLKGNKTTYLGNILVPFPPESDLSGIARPLKKGEKYLYKKTFTLPKNFCKKKVILHFGAVDQIAHVFLNKREVGKHIGGYLPFSFDITSHVSLEKENVLEVIVLDELDKTIPYGKQRKNRGGMWYTPISGIWQTVWLESVPENYVKSLKITTTLQEVTIETTGGKPNKTIKIDSLPNLNLSYEGDSISFTIPNPKLWSPENPFLYTFTLSDGEDEISSYFALRSISCETIKDKKYLFLNGKPYFFHALLDQGYFPEGIYTPRSPEVLLNDVILAKNLGFNTLRKHIKIEHPLFYFYCDKYGMLVMQDMVNSGKYNFLLDTALPTIGVKKRFTFPASKKRKTQFVNDCISTLNLLHNNPCVVYYTIFNEGWGQFDSDNIYSLLKERDSTRIFDTTSGWFFKKKTDVDSQHVYFKKINLVAKNKPLILSEFGGYSYKILEHSFNQEKTYGYKKFSSQEEFSSAIISLYTEQIIPCIKNGLNGAVLTQLTDVEDETNGLTTYDRKVVKISPKEMQNLALLIKDTFLNTTRS